MAPVTRPTNNGPTPLGIVGSIFEIRQAIADPNDNSLEAQVGRKTCDVLSSVGYDQVPLNSRTGPGYACGGYWDDQGYDAPVDSVPFTGGQCEGVQYRLIYEFNTSQSGNPVSTNTETGLGPISGFSFVQTDSPGGSSDRYEVTVTFATGPEVFNLIVGPGTVPRVQRVERVDGQPDDCGDLPPVSEPGPSNPGTPYGQPQPTSEPGFTITVDAPISNGDEYYFPVSYEFNGTRTGPTVSFNFEGNPPSLPPGGTSSEGDDVAGGEPSGESDDPLTPEEEEAGVVVIGYTWEFPAIPISRGGVPGTQPLTFYEKFASIQLKYRDGDGNEFYSEQRLICESRGSFVRPSESLGVVGVTWNTKSSFGPMLVRPIKVEE
jgi:hypothetical protein